MKRIYISLFFITSYVYATVEQALLEWKPIVDQSIITNSKYQLGRNTALNIGQTMNKDDAVNYFKSWVYFQGIKENQKHCTIDAQFNSIIESMQKTITQKFISGEFKGRISSFAVEQVKTGAQAAKEYITNIPRNIGQYIRSWWQGTPKTETKE